MTLNRYLQALRYVNLGNIDMAVRMPITLVIIQIEKAKARKPDGARMC